MLHVTGTDREQMRRELGPLMQEPGRKWTEVEPGLAAPHQRARREDGIVSRPQHHCAREPGVIEHAPHRVAGRFVDALLIASTEKARRG